MISVIKVPTLREIDESAPVSAVWKRFYEIRCEADLEAYGHTEYLPKTVEEYRHRYAVPEMPVYTNDTFLIVKDVGAGLSVEGDEVGSSLADGDASLSSEGGDAGSTLQGGDAGSYGKVSDVSNSLSFEEVNLNLILGFLVYSVQIGENLPDLYHDLYIIPEERRRGYGSAALNWIRERGLCEGKTRSEIWIPQRITGVQSGDTRQQTTVEADADTGSLLSESSEIAKAALAVSPGYYFALKHGYGLDNIEYQSALELEKEKLTQLYQYYLDLAGVEFSVEVVDFNNLDLAEITEIRNSFERDMPSSEGAVLPTYTVEDTRQMYEVMAARGNVNSAVLIRAVNDGLAVAYTKTSHIAGSSIAHQDATWVHCDYRGRYLSGLAKAANALALLDKGVRRIETENESNNHPIIATNQRFGFRLSGCEADLVSYYRGGSWEPSGS
ncbi:MAG: hypothetical protein SPG61_00205 [Arcanobacterium sp.]|nr:hypothetical protein [Arcanobacterium sp.]